MPFLNRLSVDDHGAASSLHVPQFKLRRGIGAGTIALISSTDQCRALTQPGTFHGFLLP
jgi:hypothetical protein